MAGMFGLVGAGAGNLVPLIGVLLLGWDLPSILVMYWIETGVVGPINVLKIRKATTLRPQAAAGGQAEWSIEHGQGGSGWLLPALWFLAYGFFWLILGLFVIQIANGGFYEGASRTGWMGPSGSVIAWGTASLVAGQLIAYVGDYVLTRRYLTVTSLELLRDPFVRVFVLVATIAAGSVGIALAAAPVGFLAAMVIAKTATEIWFFRPSPAADPQLR